MIFLEHDIDNTLGNRYGRWWDAFFASGGGTAVLPLSMVNSGHQVATGFAAAPDFTTENFYQAFKNMVDAELKRPPQAVVDAFAERVGNTFELTVWITNHSGQTLHAWDNNAMIGVIVYEEAHVLLTDRVVRAAVSTLLDPALAPGETALFELSTAALSGVNWDKLHVVVFVEYETGGGAFDMLQAAVPSPPDFLVWPKTLVFMVDQADPGVPTALLHMRGPAALDWTAVETLPWLTVTPMAESIATPPVVTLDPFQLVEGWQEGQLTITASRDGGTTYSESITVKAFLGDVERQSLPAIFD